MLTYAELQSNYRQFSALTGLTLTEFRLLLTAFALAYERLYPQDRTVGGPTPPEVPLAGAARGSSSPRSRSCYSSSSISRLIPSRSSWESSSA